MDQTTVVTMTLQKTHRRGVGEGSGWVLFGRAEKWMEKWFPTVEKAQAYAAKRGWFVKVVCPVND